MTPEDFMAGCERIGLTTELATTGSPAWKRVYVYQQGGAYAGRCKKDKNFRGLYLGRASFENGKFYSYKSFYNGSYEAYAIILMKDKAKILNHINFYALGQKAYNDALAQLEIKEAKESRKFTREMYKLLHLAIRGRYYNGDTTVM